MNFPKKGGASMSELWMLVKNIFSIDFFFEKYFFSTKKNRKIELKKKSSRLFKKRFYPDRCACILDGVRAMGIQDWSNGEGEWRRRGLRYGGEGTKVRRDKGDWTSGARIGDGLESKPPNSSEGRNTAWVG